MTTTPNCLPFSLRHIVRAPAAGTTVRTTHRTAVCSYWYIIRENGTDEHGPTPNFAGRGDLVDAGRTGPNGFSPTFDGTKLWKAADAASRIDPTLATATHAVGSLPRDGDPDSWRELIRAFCQTEFSAKGMIADWAIHYLPEGTDAEPIHPHVHFLITARQWRSGTGNQGRHQPRWLATTRDIKGLADRWSALTGIYPGTYRLPAAV